MTDTHKPHASIISKLEELDGRKLAFKRFPAKDGLPQGVFIYDMESGGNWLAAVVYDGKWSNGVSDPLEGLPEL